MIKAFIIAASIYENKNLDQDLVELERLGSSMDYEIVQIFTQSLKEINPSFYFGHGKIKEIASYIKDAGVEVVICNDELSPIQKNNLEDAFKVEVIDKTLLILDIFSRNASSKESKIQTRIAYLKFMLPRLIGNNSSLDRQGGGLNKGLGEKKHELNKRKILKEINKLEKELKEVEKELEIKNKSKNNSPMPKVSLVGYTNSGKSSLMNLFIELFEEDKSKKVFEKDLLFATLDITSRRITLDDKESIILSDTVGFISSLPAQLVKSFNSTLKELKNSNLLLHVIDFSSPYYLSQMEVTLETLKEIGVEDIPIINVYNKIDLPTNNPFIKDEHGVYISTTSREGIYDLVEKVKEVLYADIITCYMHIPYNDEAFPYFSKNAKILENIEKEDGMDLKIECKKADYYRFYKFLIK